METSLASDLLQTNVFSNKLVTILQSFRKSTCSKWQKSTLKQVQHHLVCLTCQNKNLLHYKYLQQKSNNERCLANIIEILISISKASKQSRENIAGLFISHILSHTSCYVSFYTLYIISEAVPEIIQEISFESLLEINSKLKRQQNAQNFKNLELIRIQETEAFIPQNIQLCQKNLDSFLWSQIQPHLPSRQKQKQQKNTQTKIPPLIIPNSKSINSSRYSAISRQQKRKGLSQFQKLASSLGQGFIAVQLGCLLANKRTREVQEFSEDENFRENYHQKFDQIQTDRLNSSRLTMHKGPLNQNQQQQENSKKYYRKVLTINLNIILKKVPESLKMYQWIQKKIQSQKKKTQVSNIENDFQYLMTCIQQICDMNLVGNISLMIEGKNDRRMTNLVESNDIFSKLIRNLKSINEVTRDLMSKISLQSQKLHLNLLMNRNKGNSSFHFSNKSEQIELSDNLLCNISTKVNEMLRVQGPWKDMKKIILIKKYSEPILLYLGSWLQSLQQLADMGHPMFYFYQNNILKTISFYLQVSSSKVSNCYFAEYNFRLFLMIKRSIVELSHPFIGPKDPFKNPNSKVPLTHKNFDLMQSFLQILTALLEGTSKHLQKLIANIFIKNIYFMQTLQNYFQYIVKQQRISAIISTLHFYKKALQTYTNSSRKTQPKPLESSISYFLFEHIADYLCPRNGCIALALTKHQSFISPTTLQECDEEQIQQSSSQKMNSAQKLPDILKNQQFSIQRYLHQIFIFISQVYYLSSPSHPDSLLVLQEDICSFYIKFSIMHFIKLYSLLTVTELANINGNSRNKTQQDGMPSTKESPHAMPKINTKQIFMIDFLKILTNVSINRTPQIARKLRQHRVLQFFVREIQLEFSVKQNIEKYIKKAVKIRSVSEAIQKGRQREKSQRKKDKQITSKDLCLNFNKKQGDKKGNGLGLNLTGEIFKKTSNEQSKNSSTNPKKMMIPALKIPPLKTQESHQYSKGSKQKNKLNTADDLPDQLPTKNTKKKSFKQQLNLKLQGLSFGSKQNSSMNRSRSPKQSCDSNLIYATQRKIRKIYSNKVLHTQSIMLILSLILYKGQLDPIYCDQMPIIRGKLNVLYILHYHLNHQRNKSIVSILSQSVSKIKPALSGQRLFKLLSNQYTDLSHYYDWTKINAGAFGVIMSAKTNLVQPKEVAIKQMNFPKNIYERCVLNDIFTEITSLEMFRLEERVTKIYNYGVIDNTYVIIMKKYTCSLRDWRLGNTQAPQAKLFPPTLPNMVMLFREVIKGLKMLHQQNVIHYDIKGDNILLQFLPNPDPRGAPKVNVVFADFGVSKIYEDQKDQLDLKSRGTQCIKPPEMLTMPLRDKKQADNYDRRKKIGTTKASDIWSLGCLLYEIVTGQFLFNSNDWVRFFMLVTGEQQDIISQYNCEKMMNNNFLIDFLKYILIRDPQHRPSIQSIFCRFQNLRQLLAPNPQRIASYNLREVNHRNISQMISDYYNFTHEPKQINMTKLDSSKTIKSEQFGRTGKVMQFFNPKFSGKITKIMEDMYFCQRQSIVLEYESTIRQSNITHIIVEAKSKINKNKFKVVEIDTGLSSDISLIYKASPRVSDILREVLLLKGKLLFVNSESNFCVNLLIFTLSYWFKCSAFETWCLINTQILQFPALNSSIVSMSKAVKMLSDIEQEIQQMPKLQCICGSVTIILKKKFQQKRGELKICKCKKNKSQNSGCFSKSCPNYLQFIRKRYNIVWEHLTWTLVNNSQLLTPLFDTDEKQIINTQIMLNSADPLGNMISNSKQSDEWNIFQCKVCQMWMLAENGKQIWLILNNLIKSSRQGIMIPNAQQDFKARTPTLNQYTLSKLHMTSQ